MAWPFVDKINDESDRRDIYKQVSGFYSTSIDKSIFGTGKFFKEQSLNNNENIYAEIEDAIDKAPETEK